jgi:predicted transporter
MDMRERIMLKSLWMSGILAAFFVFGVKIGVGLGVQVNHPAISKRKKWALFAGFVLTYLLLFLGMHFLVTGFNLLDYLDRLANALKYGMILHFILAAGLLAWGIRLLVQPPADHGRTPFKAGLLLVIPCPVCATVVLLNLTLAFSLFPLAPAVTTAVLFACFLGFILLTLTVVTLFAKRIRSMDTFLGLCMVLVSLYFGLTILVAPIYPEIKAAFAMAGANNPTGQVEGRPLALLAGTAFVFGGIGFYRSYFSKADQQ